MRVTSRGAPGLVKTERAAQGGRVPHSEYEALRTRAGVFALDDRVLVRATGADRVNFLQGMLTNDVATLRSGDGCAALLLTVQGRVVADVRVAAVDGAVLLDVDRAACEGFIAALERLIIADDVELAVDAHTRLLGVSGPATPDLVPGLAALAPFAHATATIGDVPVRVVHASTIGGEGAILHVAADGLSRVRDALVRAGAMPCEAAALEARRIEAGIPRVGVDMGEKTLALEVPVAAAISATKGCYLGQEVIARGTARGHVNRRLCGLVFSGTPAPGARLMRDGHEVGQVSSVAPSPALGSSVGLGMVRREHWDAGTALEVVEPSGAAAGVARVAAWPLA
jgi:folate-binding protein YgfZ